MEWRNLLFMHWPVPSESMRPLIPPSLDLETFDGTAWIGLVPFEMTGIRRRGLPAIPGTSAFPELNVRTYVTHDKKPGVWFFSLDAAHRLAVWTARRCFHLPYFRAEMNVSRETNRILYSSRRTHRGAPSATFAADYEPFGEPFRAVPGSFDHWLTARYCLYSADATGTTFRGEIDHAPWSLQAARADIHESTLTDWLGFSLPDSKPVLHFAKYIDVRAWTIERVDSSVPGGR